MTQDTKKDKKAEDEPIKIEHKIVAVSVVEKSAEPAPPTIQTPAPPVPHKRPPILRGMTYKIKPASMEAALYVTINDVELPDGTRRPLEIFFNTRDSTNSQWRMAVSRLLSALMRQPLPFEFAINELKQVVDPEGPYFLHKSDPAGRGKCLGVVAHIAKVMEVHCREIGLLKKPEPALPPELLAEKLAQAKEQQLHIQRCPKCHEEAVVLLDGCLTCTACGESKCG